MPFAIVTGGIDSGMEANCKQLLLKSSFARAVFLGNTALVYVLRAVNTPVCSVLERLLNRSMNKRRHARSILTDEVSISTVCCADKTEPPTPLNDVSNGGTF